MTQEIQVQTLFLALGLAQHLANQGVEFQLTRAREGILTFALAGEALVLAERWLELGVPETNCDSSVPWAAYSPSPPNCPSHGSASLTAVLKPRLKHLDLTVVEILLAEKQADRVPGLIKISRRSHADRP